MDSKGEKLAVSITGRRILMADGVRSIISFDGNEVSAECDGFTLFVEGENMRIVSLSEESGKINISGRIDGVFFRDNNGGKGRTRGQH